MVSSLIQIRRFHPEDEQAFRELNEAWISRYFVIEDEDRAILGDPNGYIIQRGGHIFMAFLDDLPVGSCALIFVAPGVFEVAKMAVAEEQRGMGIGRQLLERAIAEAKEAGARKLSLETNAKLQPAIRLYESAGFKHLPPDRQHHSAYARAGVFMELEL
jgi:GNAT superfamily N-acetyltransferase